MAPVGFNGLPYGNALVHVAIIQDHDLAGRQRGYDQLDDVRFKHRGVGCPLDDQAGPDPRWGQAHQQRDVLAPVVWRLTVGGRTRSLDEAVPG